ncbi:hypothetical protein [Mammaliicoccus sp. Dog046]|uniref:hypothetical protein n=1 Tax=Mammaliicoccus sp. Dog046 TaxID=3034233 RepID=UPI002B26274D|nr:hypothetical protein [Mammaliicoccus sp. Dog046]WQK85396.1 hypothetical protein P3U32_12440 [Mammaliicoccus sp. Dog046]
MFASTNEIYEVQNDIQLLEKNYPTFFEKLDHVVSLTRQLQIRYQYLGELITGMNKVESQPPFIKDSVLQIYTDEVKKITEDQHVNILKDIFKNHQDVKYAQIFLLILGAKPKLVFENTIIK